MFDIQVPFIHETGMMGIGISAFVIVIACMNLLLDFDNFENFKKKHPHVSTFLKSLERNTNSSTSLFRVISTSSLVPSQTL